MRQQPSFRKSLVTCVALSLTGIFIAGCGDDSDQKRGGRVVPVEVADVTMGTIRSIRVFSGSLEASASFMVSPKVSGRIESITVDIGDAVQQGRVIAELDADEYAQDLAQAEADLLVAEANLAQSKSALEIAKRTMDRANALKERGVTSESEFDVAKSELLAREASLAVSKAQLNRAEAEVASAKIRLSYTTVRATWSGDEQTRHVAERFIDEGQTVAANTGLLRIVDLNELSGVFFVTEKDYANLSVGQTVTIQTDAYRDESFSGEIERIAPVFQDTSRQARVELRIENADLKLKPGMFLRAQVEVAKVDDAVIVPEASIVTRSDEQGVFLVGSDGQTAVWSPVSIGIRQGTQVQVIGQDLSGQVVTLGQQLIEAGSSIRIANAKTDNQSGAQE